MWPADGFVWNIHLYLTCHYNSNKSNHVVTHKSILKEEIKMFHCVHKDTFCFICGHFTSQKNKRSKSEKFQLFYRSYYESEWVDEEYAPKIGCSFCFKNLGEWYGKKIEKPKYKVPMFWFNPGEHNAQNCYFCLNFVLGTNTPKKGSLQYVPTQYAVLPIEHNENSPALNVIENPIAQFDPADDAMEVDDATEQPSTSSASYVPPRQENTAPILVTQAKLNNWCRRLELSQRKSQMLTSMLKENNLLDASVTISSQKNRQAEFIPFFKTENDLSFCIDIFGLMATLNIDYDVADWRLFIDASKSGLKAVLLHNDHAYMPIPIAYSRFLKETYNSMKLIFEKVKYNEHNWDVSGDLKVIALIMGFQLGRTRNACFICTWISTAKVEHYDATWEKQTSYEIGVMNVKENSLTTPEKILLPTLHIKLGLVSSFIRKLKKDEDAFKYFKVMFPGLTIAKISAGNI